MIRDADRWQVIIPMNTMGRAKSRLSPLGRTLRQRLALAMLLDTLTAAFACPLDPDIHLVTSDPFIRRTVAALNPYVRLHACPGEGLNTAVLQPGATAALHGPAAVVLADLPALRPADLAEVLHAAARYPCAALPDMDGSGTTVLTATSASALRPAFGPDSFRKHCLNGAIPITATPGARADVDVPADVDRVLGLGVGRHTRSVLCRAMYEGPPLEAAASAWPLGGTSTAATRRAGYRGQGGCTEDVTDTIGWKV